MEKETLKNIMYFLKIKEDKSSFKWKLLNNEPLTEDELTIKGDLDLENSNITSLPDGLKVEGELDLSYSNITSLPKGLKVGGRLDLTDSDIETLPEGLEVGGNLWLAGCWGLISLPKDLKVGGSLYIYRTKFTEISDNELFNMIKPNGYIGEIIGNI